MKLDSVSRQAHAEEFHDGRSRNLSHTRWECKASAERGLRGRSKRLRRLGWLRVDARCSAHLSMLLGFGKRSAEGDVAAVEGALHPPPYCTATRPAMRTSSGKEPACIFRMTCPR